MIIPGITVFQWDIDAGKIDPSAVEGVDVIVHLAGVNIGGGRWTDHRKVQILQSRVMSAQLLYEAVRIAERKPSAYITASAVGYYGVVTRDIIFSENSPPAGDFLGSVCERWEAASRPYREMGIRTVIIRSGVVLSPRGGALEKMVLPFKFGMGTVLGSGRQYLPWIHIDDLCHIYLMAVQNDQWAGVYNAVAPHHVNNFEFSHILAKVLNRPVWLPAIPRFIIGLILGEMAKMILEGSCVSSKKVVESGYQFLYPTLTDALQDVLSPANRNNK